MAEQRGEWARALEDMVTNFIPHEQNDDFWTALSAVVPAAVREKALQIVEKGNLIRVFIQPTNVNGSCGSTCPPAAPGKNPTCEYFEVGGSGNIIYAVLPHFCTCLNFQESVLEQPKGVVCKHMLAVALCVRMEKIKDLPVSAPEFARRLSSLLSQDVQIPQGPKIQPKYYSMFKSANDKDQLESDKQYL